MARIAEVTVAAIRRAPTLEGSDFLHLYERLMRREELDDAQYIDMLRFAILFSRSSDDVVARLGYRIVLQYGEVTRDYEPLHALAMNRDLTPVVVAAERLSPDVAERESFAATFNAAHRTNFVTTTEGGASVVRTRGQMELRSFNAHEPQAIVVAPTSYGKSEMLIERIVDNLDGMTCVLVPSRALIAQTRATVIGDSRISESRIRVLTHPDAYTDEQRFVAVMTQERLQRLLVEHPDLIIDRLLVDEAHNLLDDDTRALELSQAILICRGRNPALSITYYTPFMATPGNLRHINDADAATTSKSVNEHVKAERIVLARPGESQRLYDQFLNRSFDLGIEVPADEIEAIQSVGGHRSLVYVNRPRDAQALAARLAEALGAAEISPAARRAIDAVGDLIDPNYSLISAIRSGVLFHHGQVPDVLRQYIEQLFRDDESAAPRYLVTTSTLLEGVNTPADCLVLMTPARGRAYLTQSAFRNLIGRVARFKEVFDPVRTDLDLLQPRIFLLPSSYAPKDWNVDAFLSRVANLAKDPEDKADNPFLESGPDGPERVAAVEYLINVDPRAVEDAKPRTAQTQIGKLCFQNGVREFDIFAYEHLMQERIERVISEGELSETDTVLEVVREVFLAGVELSSEELVRIRDIPEARRFYSMFLEWRTRNEPFKRLISRFLRYWSRLDGEFVYVGPKWGELPIGDGWQNLYVLMARKTRSERINLAVVKIKEEQDFVDFNILKFIEILNSIGIIEANLYLRLKYGTDDPYIICLLKNGFSPELARLVAEKYRDLVAVDIDQNAVGVSSALADAMRAAEENDILVYESSTLVNVGLVL